MKSYPRIIQYCAILLFIALVYVFMKTLRFYLIPASFGALLAMLMLPVNRRLERWRFPRIVAILISLLIVLAVISFIVMMFSRQVVSFARDVPNIQAHLKERFDDFSNFVEQRTGLPADEQVDMVKEEINKFLHSTGQLAGGILKATGGTFAGFGLLIIHFVLFLLYRGRIKGFIMQLVDPEDEVIAERVVEAIAKVIQKYLTGVLIVMTILSVLNSTGLLILGIPNAIFFGVLASVLNVIPYVGLWIGASLPVLMALISKDNAIYAVLVIGVFLVTQFIDHNFLTPRITGSQVKLNALFVIMAIIVGEMVWGIAGMVLFIPALGMFKVLCDHVPALHPYGYLISEEEVPSKLNFVNELRGKKTD